MEPEEIYLQWRWAIYNQIDISFLRLCIEMPHILTNPYGEMNLTEKYSCEIIDNYRIKKFEVSDNQIELYDKYVMEAYNHFFEMNSKHLFLPFKRSIFIENCYIIVEKYNRKDLIERIKTNLIYLHWWDVLTYDELIQSVVINYFLKSTQKLIDNKLLFNYIQQRFNSKEILIECILQNFYPSESLLEFMKIEARGSLAFDYNWLFNNDFKRSIRIFENECRYEFNEKIIGCFYNEDLLFREIKRTFGESFKVISQGSPSWLTPQRFDIYFPDLNIAIEYQGEQHFRPVDFGGKGVIFAKNQFQENLRRDISKREKAKTHNCTLFFVNPDYDIRLVIGDIKKEIKKKSFEVPDFPHL